MAKDNRPSGPKQEQNPQEEQPRSRFAGATQVEGPQPGEIERADCTDKASAEQRREIAAGFPGLHQGAIEH